MSPGNFDDVKHLLPPDLAALAKTFIGAHNEIREAPALSGISSNEANLLGAAIGSLDAWAKDAENKLKKRQWSGDTLRGGLRDSRNPFDRVEDDERKNRLARNDFNRFRAIQLTLDHCRAARAAILKADWITAVCSGIAAGNNSLGDLAITGKARGKSLPKPGSSKPLSKTKAMQREEIIREARALIDKNPEIKSEAVAHWIEDNHSNDQKFPKWEAIRKIMRQNKIGKIRRK